jgi:predicted dehydrogenase
MTASDVEEIIGVERETGCKLMYGFNHRHHESIKHAKRVVDSGEFGRILWMRGRYGKGVDDSFFDGWRANRELAGGGILLDQGIHMLDLLLYFSGGFDEVKAMVSNLFWKLDGIEDNVFANFRSSKTGIVASLHSTMTQWRHLFSLEIFLSKGHIVLNGLKTSSNSYGDEVLTLERNRLAAGGVDWGVPETRTYHTDTSWGSEVAHFLGCIQNDTQIEQGRSSDALDVMQLIEDVYDAG